MKSVITSTVMLAALSLAAAQQPDVNQLMEKSRDLTLTGSISSQITLTITEKNGSVRKRTISMNSKSYPEGTEKRFIEFLEPPDVKGTAMLVYDYKEAADEMWIWLPALKKTRRIVSSEKGKSFMSSEFSNADMSSPNIKEFTNRYATGSGENGVYIIESTPVTEEKKDEYGYSMKRTYLTMDKLVLKKIEFFNFENKLFKTIEARNIKPLENDKYIVTGMYAVNISNGRSSEIRMDKVATGQNVDDSIFTLQNLEK